jgi:uncharacterized spore protein YtfJ
MNVDEMIREAQGALSAKRVFAEPIERDGTMFLPAASVRGGGGGGSDDAGNGGGGYGVMAHPIGLFEVRDGEATWKPALDLNRAILGGQIVAIVALLVLRSIFKSRR